VAMDDGSRTGPVDVDSKRLCGCWIWHNPPFEIARRHPR
jgi:hypothetical protein